MTVTLVFLTILYFVYNLVLAFKYYRDTGDHEYIIEHGYTTQIGRVFNALGILAIGLIIELYYEIKFSW